MILKNYTETLKNNKKKRRLKNMILSSIENMVLVWYILNIGNRKLRISRDNNSSRANCRFRSLCLLGAFLIQVHESGDEWIKYDDDIVSVVNIEKVLELKGGGDFHMTYLCLYRKIEIE